MFTLYQIAFAQTRNPDRIGLLFTHDDGVFDAISVTKRSCAAMQMTKMNNVEIDLKYIVLKRTENIP